MKTAGFDYDEEFMGAREKKGGSYFCSFRDDYRLRSLVEMVKLGKGRILDVGCGGGIHTETFPYYYPKASIFGCDVSQTAINYARRFGSGKIKFAVIKNKRLPYKDAFFDVCICQDVLEHVPDVNFFLNEIFRVLKKKGTLFLIVPCEGQPFTYTWLFQKLNLGNKLTYRYFGHIHPEFTQKYVTNLLRKHKYTIDKTAYSEHIFYQLLHLTIFFLPKILLEAVLGDKAGKYTNSSLLRTPKRKGKLIVIRNLWFTVFNLIMKNIMPWETVILRDVPFTAWKIHILAGKADG